ncbi:hypothetical protein KUTeg_011449 [Tegillarca granosa]|uniref:Uncharacterized protein n=1 Tax=Tegillarca granosa TaxID=220873 RepID=A0ABQ9F0R2_TEGGR|nr:hypothetical protein KUTeg_011449 [Tegillarca granosa]
MTFMCLMLLSLHLEIFFVTGHRSNKLKKIARDNRITDIYTERDDFETRGITVRYGECSCCVVKIVEISASGQYIRTIQRFTLDHKELFTYPLFVCTNINGDIIVTDDFKVVAVNKEGTIRFIYQAEGRQLKQSFYPQYIVTDKQGGMFINDYNNSVVHVLDSDGKFIQYLITPEQGCDRPIGLDLDNHGRLWMCNYGKREIDIIKYIYIRYRNKH